MSFVKDLFNPPEAPKAPRVPKISDQKIQDDAQKERQRIAAGFGRDDTILAGKLGQRDTLISQGKTVLGQ